MTHPSIVNGVVKAIGNLSANEDNQAKIQVSVRLTPTAAVLF